eukprot:TRINITY_DN3539_c0_g1_i13.p2 TRINITY_DN3539_c0_g1~~TRINITY_DN3539_c0_g1_i13.p2  ORF type:complete len:218 (+),score=-17.22 TRINITY_DN3539_c0_g1_i13:1011-1664(+)
MAFLQLNLMLQQLDYKKSRITDQGQKIYQNIYSFQHAKQIIITIFDIIILKQKLICDYQICKYLFYPKKISQIKKSIDKLKIRKDRTKNLKLTRLFSISSKCSQQIIQTHKQAFEKKTLLQPLNIIFTPKKCCCIFSMQVLYNHLVQLQIQQQFVQNFSIIQRDDNFFLIAFKQISEKPAVKTCKKYLFVLINISLTLLSFNRFIQTIFFNQLGNFF